MVNAASGQQGIEKVRQELTSEMVPAFTPVCSVLICLYSAWGESMREQLRKPFTGILELSRRAQQGQGIEQRREHDHAFPDNHKQQD